MPDRQSLQAPELLAHTDLHLLPLSRGESLPLTNSGVLELFWLGVGSAFSAVHNHVNLILVKGDTHLAIDCGVTFNMGLTEVARLSATDITAVLPTHSHPDHVGCLADYALRHRYPGVRFLGHDLPRLLVTPEYAESLWGETLRGGLAYNETPLGQPLQLADFFDVRHPDPIPGTDGRCFHMRFGDLNLQWFRTIHIPECADDWRESAISYGLYLPDERVFVSMDTQFDPGLIEQYAPISDVMFHDVQFFSGGVHAPLDELRQLPPEVKRKMLLMHYNDNWDEQDIRDFAGWTCQGVRYAFG